MSVSFVCIEVTQQDRSKKPPAPAILFAFNFCHAKSIALLLKLSAISV